MVDVTAVYFREPTGMRAGLRRTLNAPALKGHGNHGGEALIWRMQEIYSRVSLECECEVGEDLPMDLCKGTD